MAIHFLEVAALVGILYLLFKVVKLQNYVRGMKYNLDLIMKQVGTPENPIDDELHILLKEGKDVKAVKVAREKMGLSLLEGKQYVDKLKADIE
ncbi:hypothetical protein [Oceanobacillus halophilus]|uniref:Ribosomal protein L7/L12 C-terminal domain-containing protein n=1 Tax=Oceanobacillus halophilus TaxID=930130 RepID=A0A495A547_9BACI|nr:hypothetical protein [Oceanobacillus halophilus]RKQ34663.1 hypothetical protein D8M06_07000 [Oceanobacillus halophilus]